MKHLAILSYFLLTTFLGAKEINTLSRDKYVGLGKMTNEVFNIFNINTIDKKLFFSIDVNEDIFKVLFANLDFAVEKANLYAKKKYTIKAEGDHWDAFDGDKTRAKIYTLMADSVNNTFIYYLVGEYSGGLKVKGNMLMEVKFEKQADNTFFFITAYVSIDDPFLRGVAGFLSNFKSFKDFTDRLIEGTIGEIRRVGFVTARALDKDRTSTPFKR